MPKPTERLAIVERHLKDNLNISEIAEASGLSRPTVRKYVRQLTRGHPSKRMAGLIEVEPERGETPERIVSLYKKAFGGNYKFIGERKEPGSPRIFLIAKENKVP